MTTWEDEVVAKTLMGLAVLYALSLVFALIMLIIHYPYQTLRVIVIISGIGVFCYLLGVVTFAILDTF